MDLMLEWGQDLVLTANGSLQTVENWDQVRERIIRRLLTNSAQKLPSGYSTPPDYIFHPSFGLGAGALVSQNLNQTYLQELEQKIVAAVQQDAAVAPGSVPSIAFISQTPQTLEVFITVQLATGQQGQVVLAVS